LFHVLFVSRSLPLLLLWKYILLPSRNVSNITITFCH
jgi:hypothetical protein